MHAIWITYTSPESDHIPPSSATSTIISYLGFCRSLLTSHTAPSLDQMVWSSRSSQSASVGCQPDHVAPSCLESCPPPAPATQMLGGAFQLVLAKTLTPAVPSPWSVPFIVNAFLSHPPCPAPPHTHFIHVLVLSYFTRGTSLTSPHNRAASTCPCSPLTAPLPSIALIIPCTPCVILFVRLVCPPEVALFCLPCIPRT